MTTETAKIRVVLDLDLTINHDSKMLRDLATQIAEETAEDINVARARWTQIIPYEPDFQWENEVPVDA
jgi:hypothetical protein